MFSLRLYVTPYAMPTFNANLRFISIIDLILIVNNN